MRIHTGAVQRIVCGAVSLLLAAGVFFSLPVAATQADPGSSSSDSSTSVPEPTPVPGSAPVVTGYTVQNSAGQELQRISEGQKCMIVVGIWDTAFNSANKDQVVYDERGNIANVKITSTGSFGSPSLGDIRFTTPKFDADGVSYSIIFNDITYLGGDNKLSFDLTYNDLKHQLTNLSVGISQCVGSTTEGGKSSALVVKSASYGTGEVQAGKEFDLTAEILATAGTSAIDMVQVSLQLPEKITVVSGNNNYYIGKINADSSAQVSFKLMAGATTDPGSYNITINVSGIANDGTAVNNSLQITVPVVQPERFEITNVEAYTPIYTGEEGNVSVTYVNKGKGVIYNLSAKIEGEGMDNAGQNQYLGNLAAGTEGSVDFSVMASNPGTVNGKVILTYEDEKGEEKSLETNFSVEVMQMEEMDPGMMDPGMTDPDMMEGNQGMPLWGWLLIGAGAIGVVVVVVVLLKKRKAKKQRLEDEDEDI